MPSLFRFLVLAAVLAQAAALPAATPEPAGGLAITVGPTDGTREVDLLGKGRFLVAHVTRDAAEAARLRAHFASLGLAGAITVVEAVEPGRLPFIEDVVAQAVIDGPSVPTDAEILRVLRPEGVARITTAGATRLLVRPWPAEYAHWGQFQRDGSMNPVTPDRAVGVPSGFQWVSDSDGDKRSEYGLDIYGQRILDGICVNFQQGDRFPMLSARDAFSGLQLWSTAISQVQSTPFHQYGFLAAEGRVYIHVLSERYAKSFDLRTGAQLTVYDQGATFPGGTAKPPAGFELRRDLVHRGVLIQVYGSTIHALDFATGAVRWKRTHPQGRGWDHPAIEDDVLVVAESTSADTSNVRKLLGYIKSWTTEVDALTGISLVDGRQLWRTPLPQPIYPIDSCLRDGRYLMTQAKLSSNGTPEPDAKVPGLCISTRDGAILWQQPMEWTGGHPPHAMATAGNFWLTSHFGGIGFPLTGGQALLRNDMKAGDFGLWGCNTTWMSERYLYSRLSVTDITTGRYRLNTAVRSACVFGSIPAHGLLYSTPHGCGCHAFVGGYNSVHSRDMVPLRTPWTGTRLLTGPGRPSPAPAAATDEWPIYQCDSARSNWNSSTLPAQPALAWSVPAPVSQAPTWLKGLWSAAVQGRPGPVTALTAAEGVVAGAYTEQQTVFVLDAATGAARWTRQLDSLIDTPPTIHRGVLYVGTRGGWLWALSRDSGEVIWRFLASPHQRLMVVNGAIESVWPLFGTVAVHDDRLWISAGRSAELDNGITWYSLDPATGAVRSTGRLHDDAPWFEPGVTATGSARIKGINSPLIINGDVAMLAPTAFRPSNGSVLVGGRDYATNQYEGTRHYQTPVIVPGRLGLVYSGPTGAQRTGPFHFYGGVGARLIAYRGDDFVVTQGGLSSARGGAGGHVGRWRKLAPYSNTNWNAQAEPLWQDLNLFGGRDTASGLAVADDTVVTVIPQNQAPVMTRYRYADGVRLGQTPLPAWPVLGGIAVAKGRIFAALRDGSVRCFAAATTGNQPPTIGSAQASPAVLVLP